MLKKTFRRFKKCTKLNKRKIKSKRTLKKYGGSYTEKDENITRLNRKKRDIIAEKDKLEAIEMELNERKTERTKKEVQYRKDILDIKRAIYLLDNENEMELKERQTERETEKETERIKKRVQYREDILDIKRAIYLLDKENDKEEEIMINIEKDKNSLDSELQKIYEELQRIQEE